MVKRRLQKYSRKKKTNNKKSKESYTEDIESNKTLRELTFDSKIEAIEVAREFKGHKVSVKTMGEFGFFSNVIRIYI